MAVANAQGRQGERHGREWRKGRKTECAWGRGDTVAADDPSDVYGIDIR